MKRNIEYSVRKRKQLFLISLVLILQTVSCVLTSETVRLITSTPQTIQLSLTPSSTIQPTITIIIPTSTPIENVYQTYKVKEGDTLSEIAFRLGISVKDILNANEGLDERIIPQGSSIIIPKIENGKVVLPTPTPLPLSVSPVQCYANGINGVWCFATVKNELADPIDEVSAKLELYVPPGIKAAEQDIALPLSRLEAGKSLPLFAYFSNAAKEGLAATALILSALPAKNGDGRFLPVNINLIDSQKIGEGKAFHVKGEIQITAENSNPTTYIKIAAVAYNQTGFVVGIKMWDWEGSLSTNQSLPFEGVIFSTYEEITHVEIQAEARVK